MVLASLFLSFVILLTIRPSLLSTPDLKEELVHVQSLLQDEQSMYQTSNQALNLVVEAQNEELKHARAATTNTQGHQHSTMDELKEFDIKAKEYEEAIKESKEVEKSDNANASTPPHEWIF